MTFRSVLSSIRGVLILAYELGNKLSYNSGWKNLNRPTMHPGIVCSRVSPHLWLPCAYFHSKCVSRQLITTNWVKPIHHRDEGSATGEGDAIILSPAVIGRWKPLKGSKNFTRTWLDGRWWLPIAVGRVHYSGRVSLRGFMSDHSEHVIWDGGGGI